MFRSLAMWIVYVISVAGIGIALMVLRPQRVEAQVSQCCIADNGCGANQM